MTTTSTCIERWLLCATVLLLLTASGCEREEAPRRFSPGGEYFQRLDASGRKYVITADGDRTLAKLRVRHHEIKVYDDQMRSMGSVTWSDDSEAREVVIEPRAAEPVRLRKQGASGDAFELEGRFRIERVEKGWGVFDADGQRLGYVEESEPGEYALRDDYSSPPRAWARTSDAAVKTPSGRTLVAASPEFRSALLLGFAFEGDLDPLERVAFGLWLENIKPPP